MHCESCEAPISSKMRGALINNSCPFCASEVMQEAKATQYFKLLETLDQTTFTNKEAVDAQIREKVANLLITKFVFKRLDLPESESDIVVLDDEVEELQVVAPQVTKKITNKIPTPVKRSSLQTKSSTGKVLNTVTEDNLDEAMTSQARSVPSSPPKLPKGTVAPPPGLSIKDYLGAQDGMYVGTTPTSSAKSQISAEEVMKMFPNMSVDQAVEALRGEVESAQTVNSHSSGLTGKGIKRV